MIRPKHSYTVSEQLLEGGNSPSRVSAFAAAALSAASPQ